MAISGFSKKEKEDNIFYNYFLKTERERRLKGDDLGILVYLIGLIIIIITSLIYLSESIKDLNLFYLWFDILGLSYVIIYLINKKIEKRKLIQIYDPYEFLSMFILVTLCFFIAFLLNQIIFIIYFASMTSNDLYLELFLLIRVVATEEMAFRGLFMFIPVYLLSKLFNRKADENREKKIWYFSIILIGIFFGLSHFPKYYNEMTFPYFYIFSGNEILQLHILLPLIYLSVLGILLGFCRYKYGLFASFLLHLINNIVAEGILYAIIYFL